MGSQGLGKIVSIFVFSAAYMKALKVVWAVRHQDEKIDAFIQSIFILKCTLKILK